jgi:hypothetical protein
MKKFDAMLAIIRPALPACGRVSSVAVPAVAAALAGVAFASPAAAAVDQPIEVSQCVHRSGDPQGCGQTPGAQIDTAGPGLTISFTASPQHCSDIQVTFLVDGNPVTGGMPVGPGQTVETTYAAARAGHHNVEVSAYGIPGGCNTGTLLSWKGILHVAPSPVRFDDNP